MARTKQTSRKNGGAQLPSAAARQIRRATNNASSPSLEEDVPIGVASTMANGGDPRRLASDAVSYHNDPATIQIGSQREFVIQRHVAGATSKLLHRVFCDGSKTSEYSMAQEKPDMFNLYVYWLHSGTLATKSAAPETNSQNINAAKEQVKNEIEYGSLVNLYFLAKRLEDNAFGNAVIDGITGKFNELEEQSRNRVIDRSFNLLAEDDGDRSEGADVPTLPGPTIVNEIYKADFTHSQKLKELIVKLYAHGNSKVALEEYGLEKYPAQFHTDLIIGLLDAREITDQSAEPIETCSFHTHSESETCAASGSRKRKR